MCNLLSYIDNEKFAAELPTKHVHYRHILTNGLTNIGCAKEKDGNPILCAYPNNGDMSNMKNAP